MRGKNKKRSNVLDRKNLFVLAIAAAFVVAIAFVMSMLLANFEEEDTTFNKNAWEEAVSEAENSLEERVREEETGLTSVYNENAVSASVNAVPANAETEQKEDKAEDRQESNEAAGYAPPLSGAVLKDYSGDELVYSETMHDWRTHNGIDFSAEEGTDVLSVADGTVEAVTDNSLLGTTVIILHSGGLRSIYSNLAERPPVDVGTDIKQGMPVGKVGSSAALEISELPHLHFEMSLNEETVNPHDYISL